MIVAVFLAKTLILFQLFDKVLFPKPLEVRKLLVRGLNAKYVKTISILVNTVLNIETFTECLELWTPTCQPLRDLNLNFQLTVCHVMEL